MFNQHDKITKRLNKFAKKHESPKKEMLVSFKRWVKAKEWAKAKILLLPQTLLMTAAVSPMFRRTVMTINTATSDCQEVSNTMFDFLDHSTA